MLHWRKFVIVFIISKDCNNIAAAAAVNKAAATLSLYGPRIISPNLSYRIRNE